MTCFKRIAILTTLALVAGAVCPCVLGEETRSARSTRLTGKVSSSAEQEIAGLYRKGEYKRLLSRIGEPPKTELLRYYRALALQQLNQREAAIRDFKWIYYRSREQSLRYKAWQALKALARVADQNKSKRASAARTGVAKSHPEGPGMDAWVTPKKGYGQSGPPATSSKRVTIIPTACGKRRR